MPQCIIKVNLLRSIPDCVEEVWDEVEIGPVLKKVSEHYLECHDEMQASKAEQQVDPKPQLHHRDGWQAKARAHSAVACIVEAKGETCVSPAIQPNNIMRPFGSDVDILIVQMVNMNYQKHTL